MNQTNEWKKVYPYTLDKPLEEAIEIALDQNDLKMAKSIWEIFISYRKSKQIGATGE